jgi:hypothetical protein
MEMVFPAGRSAHPAGPLARFMPPLDEGMAAEALTGFGQKGDLVLDPFGASPRLAVEAARAERAVIVAANNPVTRFVLRQRAMPPALATMHAALARLAAAPKDHARLEPFILDLYRTECARCGEAAIADYFVWEREAEGPILKGYVCERCSHAGEDPTTEADWARAQEHSRRGLQQALALEQVAPAGDPDRQHAEAALAVYPARAIYALISIVSKLEQLDLDPAMAEAAQALLLSASDAANALWGHPEGRARPLALVASPRYREINVWRALERAADEWATAAEVPSRIGNLAAGPGDDLGLSWAGATWCYLPPGGAPSSHVLRPTRRIDLSAVGSLAVGRPRLRRWGCVAASCYDWRGTRGALRTALAAWPPRSHRRRRRWR